MTLDHDSPKKVLALILTISHIIGMALLKWLDFSEPWVPPNKEQTAAS